MTSLPFDKLVEKIASLLKQNGCYSFVADSVAFGLSETSLRGVDSHGIRLLPHYARALKAGRINGNPKFSVESKYSSFISVDSDNTFGHASGFYAIDRCCEKAETSGVCVAAVYNSSHPGAMASYVYRAAEKGYAAFAFTHADSLIQSHLGTTTFFGTNPICFGTPRKTEPPFCVDMAPSYIPWNKVKNHIETVTQLDCPYAVYSSGAITLDPSEAAALLPIAGHKGFALAALVEVLCSCLTGMNFGPNIPSIYGSPITDSRKLGQFYIVMRVDGCCTENDFYESIQNLGASLRQSSPGSAVLMPNDPQIIESKRRMQEGIEIPLEVESLFLSYNL